MSTGEHTTLPPSPSPKDPRSSDLSSHHYLGQKSSLISLDPHTLFLRPLQPLGPFGMLSPSLKAPK